MCFTEAGTENNMKLLVNKMKNFHRMMVSSNSYFRLLFLLPSLEWLPLRLAIMVGMVMDMAMAMDTMEDMATTMARGKPRLLLLLNQDIMVDTMVVMDMVTALVMDMDMEGMAIMDTMVRGMLMLSLDIMEDMVMVMVMDMDMVMGMDMAMEAMDTMDTMGRDLLMLNQDTMAAMDMAAMDMVDMVMGTVMVMVMVMDTMVKQYLTSSQSSVQQKWIFADLFKRSTEIKIKIEINIHSCSKYISKCLFTDTPKIS